MLAPCSSSAGPSCPRLPSSRQIHASLVRLVHAGCLACSQGKACQALAKASSSLAAHPIAGPGSSCNQLCGQWGQVQTSPVPSSMTPVTRQAPIQLTGMRGMQGRL